MKLIDIALILKKIIKKLTKFWDKLIDMMQSFAKSLKRRLGDALKGCKTVLKKTVNGTKTVLEKIVRAYEYVKYEWILHEKIKKISEDEVPEDIRRQVRYKNEADITSETERELLLAT